MPFLLEQVSQPHRKNGAGVYDEDLRHQRIPNSAVQLSPKSMGEQAKQGYKDVNYL
jgi:hypothetical protein